MWHARAPSILVSTCACTCTGTIQLTWGLLNLSILLVLLLFLWGIVSVVFRGCRGRGWECGVAFFAFNLNLLYNVWNKKWMPQNNNRSHTCSNSLRKVEELYHVFQMHCHKSASGSCTLRCTPSSAGAHVTYLVRLRKTWLQGSKKKERKKERQSKGSAVAVGCGAKTRGASVKRNLANALAKLTRPTTLDDTERRAKNSADGAFSGFTY